MEDLKVKRIRVRELTPEAGDRVQVMTIEKAQELDYASMVTVFPHGEVAHSFNDMIQIARGYEVEELEVVRFAPMAGG